MTSKIVFKQTKVVGKSSYSHYIYTKMDGQMFKVQLLIEECVNGCKGFLKEKLQRKYGTLYLGLCNYTHSLSVYCYECLA